MNTLRKLSVATAATAFIVGTVSAAQAVTLSSAELGTTGETGGFTIDNSHFLGWKFQLNSALQVTGIGGHLRSSGNIFGAIVALSGSNALPQGNPFDAEEVLASTTFNAGSLSSDAITPLSVTLAPGNYGLVFGSGEFGATGAGSMPNNNLDFPESKYFFFDGNSANSSWFNVSNTRFVVEGNPVVVAANAGTPVPFEFSPGLGILGLGACGAVARLNSLVQKRKSSKSGFFNN